ncbi:ATP-binding protein [uncultured Cyclobacterium sp.]|uniref:sensor histidine kinase n=1 Tax=uncultured Cyclobacterium sp. TaxID=453820 RepID=UPI0030EE6C2D|tara:strand:- start:147320 stop:148723 length:1404 start_codon:yes stop_codon:yes gene_type:complete
MVSTLGDFFTQQQLIFMWNKYVRFIKKTCLATEEKANPLNHWRDRLFISGLVYLLPFCLIALIPGLIMAYLNNHAAIFIFDSSAFLVSAMAAFMPGIPLIIRKWAVLLIFYLTGASLIFFVGNFGPGLMYLLAVSVLMILFLPNKQAFISFYLNLVTCILFSLLIHFEAIVQLPNLPSLDLMHWITVSANLIFLSGVFSFLIPKLFSRLENSLREQYSLQEKLKRGTVKLKKSLHEVESKNKELEHFTFVVSHDLQEPLRMISGFMGLLKKKYGSQLDDKANTFITYAVDGANRMRHLILDLSEYSRINKITEAPILLDPEKTLMDIKLTFQSEISKKNAQITTGPLVKFLGYPSFFSLLIQNLIGNSLKYSDPSRPPKIHFTMEERDNDYLFQINDNGIGIDSNYFDKIFILFQRLQNKETGHGTGMGLAIVKKVTEILGGKIWVASEVGKGTKFTFTLPKHSLKF